MSRSSVVLAVGIILQFAGGIVAQDDTAGEVNPCTDFYSYACKVRNSVRSPKWIRLEDLLDNYLFESKEQSDVGKEIYKFREYCTQTSVEDKKKFLRKFNPSVDGWPAFNKNWKAGKFDLQAALAELHSFNLPSVFMMLLTNEVRYLSRNLLHVQPHIEDKLFDDDYEERVKRKLSNVIDDDDVDEVISDSRTVVALFVAEKNSTDENVSTNYKGLKREIPEIDWDKQFEIMYGQIVPDSFLVVIYQLGQLKRIIQKMFEVEPKVMANYLFYRLVYFLPDLDENMLPPLLEDIAYDMLRQQYTSDTKEKLREMLVSFLKNLDNTVNLFGDEDKAQAEKTISEFVMDETLPEIDDSYFDNTYGKITVSEDDCYTTVAKLIHTHWRLKSKIYLKREVDPLYFMRFELRNTLMHYLPAVLDKSSVIKFDVLIWSSLSNYFWEWEPAKFKLVQQCLEKQIGEKLDKRKMGDVLKIKIFTKSYFDWAKDKANLLQLEETKYNESSKQVFLERLIARYCNYDRSSYYRLQKSTVSEIFGKMKEVSEVYNCPVRSQFNPQFTCEL